MRSFTKVLAGPVTIERDIRHAPRVKLHEPTLSAMRAKNCRLRRIEKMTLQT
jgi:hypothetical protein